MHSSYLLLIDIAVATNDHYYFDKHMHILREKRNERKEKEKKIEEYRIFYKSIVAS